MRSKINGFLTLILAFVVQLTFAQTKTISGKVSDNTGPLPGVVVLIKGTQKGTQTDFDGNYSIDAKQGATLQFSYVGMKTTEVIVGNTNKINITLIEDTEALEEVVVTAIGITREKRSLGYAATVIKSEELTKARESNIVNSLAGKVAGVRVTSQSGTLGGSSKIIIRGASSMGGNNQPLFVVDGIPISNSGFNGTRGQIIAGGVDAGNRASDINSDDVETMTVLKGAAAAALYGARAKNGAIIITTKRGKKNTEMSITVNSSLRFDNVLKLPEFQNEYAQGNDGVYDKDDSNGWGPKISDSQGSLFEDYTGAMVTLKANPDNVKNFYETGVSYINSFGFAGGDDKSDFRLGITNFDQTGVTPDSELKKTTIALNAGRDISDKLNVRASINYTKSNTSGKPAQGSNDPNVITNIVNGLPRTVSNSLLYNNITDANGLPYEVARNTNNPYWITQNNKWSNRLNRIFGNITLNYEFNSWLSSTVIVGNDYYNEWRQHITAKNTITAAEGRFNLRNITRNQLNTDVMLNINKNFNDDEITLRAVIGHNTNERFSNLDYTTVNDLVADGLYVPQNGKSVAANSTSFKQRLVGAYFNVSLGFKDIVYLDITGRNDWSSTLPKQNQSYFYPSVSSSFIFSKLLPENDILSFGKLRVNWANVGSDTTPYGLDFVYEPKDTYFLQYLGYQGVFPHGSYSAFQAPNTIPSGDSLKPQNVVSQEIGLELKFLQNRLGLDFSYYKKNTTDQILNIAVAKSTGFWYKLINAGEVQNQGIEIGLTGTPILTENFTWGVNFNFSSNENKVVELVEGLNEYSLTSGWSGLAIKAAPGESFGLYGTAWERDPDGNIVYDATTGRRNIVTDQRLGDIYPDWTLGIGNTIRYKNFSMSALVDIRQGGVIYSATSQALRVQGLSADTAANRDAPFVPEGVINNGDGTYSPNTTEVTAQAFWEDAASNSNTEGNIYDASYIKLREVTLSYELPKSIVEKTFFNSISLGIEGRNLWIIKDHIPHVDPEVNFFGSSLTGEGVEFQSVPSTRSLGGNIKLTF
ncbi:SusC/RagA family TonB-linked outer membrane protein [Flavicella sediminum]|uniref:SusC/RagA family TonB-linked outer membrane protein n=1 Tax=Flavicella sediminum TaxID=2585141 RepID=UPI0011241B1C|nr:SusC/RagA family TonB-linked outer membrane protein [Flavicella sediminum]